MMGREQTVNQPAVGIVDRFEGDVAVIETDGETRDVPRPLVAADVKEGDVVEWKDGQWMRNEQATKERSAEIKTLMDSLWED